MNLEALNRYVLVAVGLFAVLLYLAMLYVGLSELISRMPKRARGRKRPKDSRATRRL